MKIINTKPSPEVWCRSLRDSHLPAETKLVGAVLAAYLRDDGIAAPGLKALAGVSGLSEYAVSRALFALVIAGRIERVRGRIILASGSYDHFRLTVDAA